MKQAITFKMNFMVMNIPDPLNQSPCVQFAGTAQELMDNLNALTYNNFNYNNIKKEKFDLELSFYKGFN